MFNLGFSELILLAIIALIFIGPKELPEIARTIGRFLNDLKRTTSDLSSTIMKPQEHLRDELQSLAKGIEEELKPHEGDKLEFPMNEEGDWSTGPSTAKTSPTPEPVVTPSTATEKPKGET